MDFLGQALARWYLSEQGYLVSFDVILRGAETEESPVYRFDLAAVRFKNGKAHQAAVGALRSWWSPTAYLSPSRVRLHLLPGLVESLSEEAVEAFRARFDLGNVPVGRLLFFSHASPEKSLEAEEILRAHGFETIYLERVAAQLMQSPSSRLVHSDPLVMQVIGLLKGAARESKEGQTPLAEEPAAEAAPISPQLPLDLPMAKQVKK